MLHEPLKMLVIEVDWRGSSNEFEIIRRSFPLLLKQFSSLLGFFSHKRPCFCFCFHLILNRFAGAVVERTSELLRNVFPPLLRQFDTLYESNPRRGDDWGTDDTEFIKALLSVGILEP